MSDITTAAPQQAAPLVINHQYVKDLSFEVPGAPQIFSNLRNQPQVTINLDVQARRVHEDQPVFEVTLLIRVVANDVSDATAKTDPPTVFICDLTYCGLFTLSAIPNEQVEPVLLIECPRLLFPFARNILADVSREAGFPPVMLQPIDFVGLWHSRRAQQEAAGGNA